MTGWPRIYVCARCGNDWMLNRWTGEQCDCGGRLRRVDRAVAARAASEAAHERMLR